MVSPTHWGPPLWRILHSCAERLGNQKFVLLAEDERRAWIQLLRDLDTVLPCAICRTHYRAWCKKVGCPHPIPSFQRRNGEAFREAARIWLWELHEQVNTSRDLPMEGRPACSDLPALYGSTTTDALDTDVQLFFTVLKEATLLQQVDGAAIHKFRATLGLLRKLIGV